MFLKQTKLDEYFCRFRYISPIVSYSYFDCYKHRDVSSIVCAEREGFLGKVIGWYN